MKQEIHIHIHTEDPENTLTSRTKASVFGRARSRRRQIFDFETSIIESFWKRNLYNQFMKGLPVWYTLQGSKADSSSGGTNEGAGLEPDIAYHEDAMRKCFRSAHGLHIKKEKLVDTMVKNGLKHSRARGFPEEAMQQYLEYTIQLYADAIELKDENAAQLKGRIYQTRMQLAS